MHTERIVQISLKHSDQTLQKQFNFDLMCPLSNLVNLSPIIHHTRHTALQKNYIGLRAVLAYDTAHTAYSTQIVLSAKTTFLCGDKPLGMSAFSLHSLPLVKLYSQFCFLTQWCPLVV